MNSPEQLRNAECGMRTGGTRGQGTGGRGQPAQRQPATTSAFTLIELMVVIVIILILIGVGLTVGTSLTRDQEASRTRAILSNALQIATEYEYDTNQRVNHLEIPLNVQLPTILGTAGGSKPAFDWTTPKAYNSPTGTAGTSQDLRDDGGDLAARQEDFQENSIERFVWATARIQSLQKLYATFKPDTLKDGNPVASEKGFLELRDAWGHPLVYAAYVIDEGATVGYGLPDDFLPRREEAFFASAGPDKKWGSVDPDNTNETLALEAADNIYSFDVLNKQ